MSETETLHIQTASSLLSGYTKEIGWLSFVQVLQELYAKGAKPKAIECRITLPDKAGKNRMNQLMKQIRQYAEKEDLSLKITGEFHPAIAEPAVWMSAVGIGGDTAENELPRTGQQIVLAGQVGLAGTLCIAGEKKEELKQWFPATFLGGLDSYKTTLLKKEGICLAKETFGAYVRAVHEGGILAALHYLAKDLGQGYEVQMKKLTILQETVELCEPYRINPYQLLSTGCFLAVTEKGEELAAGLQAMGIKACIIGQMSEDRDKKILNGEEIRYVDRPAQDEYKKIRENERR